MTSQSALVLFSGGQDSTVCLVWALKRYDHVETIGFDYGQRHKVELTCRGDVLDALRSGFPELEPKLGDDHMVELKGLAAISETGLTRDMAIEMEENGLPNTFVPGRNLLFFTYAAALAYRRGISDLIGGMCETDYSGYPDCREATMRALEQSLRLGTEVDFNIKTPLMYIDKAGTWAMAHELGGDRFVELIKDKTHTCYMGDRKTRHDWGYGCGTCPACELRANGYKAWVLSSANN